jgi:hypothetical protein
VVAGIMPDAANDILGGACGAKQRQRGRERQAGSGAGWHAPAGTQRGEEGARKSDCLPR